MRKRSHLLMTGILSVILFSCNSSQDYNTFFYKMYEVQGHVKTIDNTTFPAEYNDGAYVKNGEAQGQVEYHFNKDGYLTKAGQFIYTYNADNSFKEGKIEGSENDYNVILHINELGQAYGKDIIPINPEKETDECKTKYFFDINGALIREETIYWEGRDEQEYQCNEQGLRTHYRNSYQYDYETNTILDYDYEYLKFDKQGNWIERGIKITETNQDINIETNAVTNSTTTTRYLVEYREIAYY